MQEQARPKYLYDSGHKGPTLPTSHSLIFCRVSLLSWIVLGGCHVFSVLRAGLPFIGLAAIWGVWGMTGLVRCIRGGSANHPTLFPCHRGRSFDI